MLLIDRKAHPDEKGTESGRVASYGRPPWGHRKAHPDEKGTESNVGDEHGTGSHDHRKAHPDEKGTESYFFFVRISVLSGISQGPSRRKGN